MALCVGRSEFVDFVVDYAANFFRQARRILRIQADVCFPVANTFGGIWLKSVLSAVVDAVLATRDVRFEQLINGLVFELFFPNDLHRANIRLFDACEKAGVGKLATLKDKALITAANELAERIFATSHPIYGMLFDLQGLDVVRIIEGRE